MATKKKRIMISLADEIADELETRGKKTGLGKSGVIAMLIENDKLKRKA